MVFILIETSLSTNSYSFIFFLLVCKLRKSLHFGSVKIHQHCLYWKVFCANIYRKNFSNSLLLFSYISWSVNCKSWDSKSYKVRFIFEDFKYFPLRKVQLQLSSTFLAFFHLVCKFFKRLFWLLFQ